MKRLASFIFMLVNALVACTDTNEYSRTFQYAIENNLNMQTSLAFYNDSSLQHNIMTMILMPGDSALFYECVSLTSEGICSPFARENNTIGNESNFGSFIFSDGKRLDFRRLLDSEFNLFFDYQYDTFIRPSNRLRIAVFNIDTTEYLLAK